MCVHVCMCVFDKHSLLRNIRGIRVIGFLYLFGLFELLGLLAFVTSGAGDPIEGHRMGVVAPSTTHRGLCRRGGR